MTIVNRTDGILESIHYPNPYSANQRCNWTIQATAGNTVNYTFLEFELESHLTCSADYLEVCILRLSTWLYFQIVRQAKLEGITPWRTEFLTLPWCLNRNISCLFLCIIVILKIFKLLNYIHKEWPMFLASLLTFRLTALMLIKYAEGEEELLFLVNCFYVCSL